MAKAGQQFEQVGQDLQTTLSQLMRELEQLGGNWKGRGAVAFEQVKLQYAQDLKALNQALTETAESIKASSVGYDSSDSTAASKVANSGGSFSLPL